jgi:hypothetical protein
MIAMTNQALDQKKILADDSVQKIIQEKAGEQKEKDAGWWLSSNVTKSYVPVWFDQTNQRDGYLVDTVVDTPLWKIKAAVDVIKPQWLGTEYRDNSFQDDMNGNPNDGADIVLWDADTIYIKYAAQKDIQTAHNTTKIIYRLPALTSPSQLDQLTNMNDGYLAYDPGILSRSQWFRIWSHSYAVTNFQLQWQDYDNIILQWLNPDVIGQAKNESYLVRFTSLVDRHPDRMGPDSSTQYVLVVPSGMIIDPLKTKIMIPWSTTERTIKYLTDRAILHDVVNYDPTQENVVWLLRNLSRKWNYAQVLRVELLDGVYVRTSPWSNQDVWWFQIAGDVISPVPEVKLIRKATNKEVW